MQQRSHSRGTNSKPSTPRGASVKPSSFQAFMKDKLSLDNVAKYSTRVLEDLKSSSTLAATKDVAAKISTDVASTATKVSSEVNRAIASLSPTNAIGGSKSSTSEAQDGKLAQLCEFGFEPTAAQNALKRSGGNLATAAHWLFQERESKDGEESKNESHKGHVDGGSCSSGVSVPSPCSASSLTKQAASSSSEPSSRRRCPAADDDDDPFRLTSHDLVEAEEEAEHNGFGLGIAARRRSWLSCPAAAASKSPAKASPAPNAIQEQHPLASEPEPTPIDASTSAETSAAAIQEEDVDPTSGAKDIDSDCSDDSASTGQENSEATPDVDGIFVPPDSEFWDWPLSREEKKSRVAQYDAIEKEMDMVSMMKELEELRKFKQRRSSAASRRSSAVSCSSARTDCTGVSCAGASGASGPTAGADTSPSKRPRELDDRDEMHADE